MSYIILIQLEYKRYLMHVSPHSCHFYGAKKLVSFRHVPEVPTTSGKIER